MKNLPITLVTEIITSQFDFVSHEMSKGINEDPDSFKTILLKYLGTFKFDSKKHRRVVEAIKKKKLRDA